MSLLLYFIINSGEFFLKSANKFYIKFINSISQKIASTFYNLKMNEALEFLIQFDSDNKNNYIKYLEWSKKHITAY